MTKNEKKNIFCAKNEVSKGQLYSSVVKHLPVTHKVLDSIPSIGPLPEGKKKEREKKQCAGGSHLLS